MTILVLMFYRHNSYSFGANQWLRQPYFTSAYSRSFGIHASSSEGPIYFRPQVLSWELLYLNLFCYHAVAGTSLSLHYDRHSLFSFLSLHLSDFVHTSRLSYINVYWLCIYWYKLPLSCCICAYQRILPIFINYQRLSSTNARTYYNKRQDRNFTHFCIWIYCLWGVRSLPVLFKWGLYRDSVWYIK